LVVFTKIHLWLVLLSTRAFGNAVLVWTVRLPILDYLTVSARCRPHIGLQQHSGFVWDVGMLPCLGLRHSRCRGTLANQASIDFVVIAKMQLWVIVLITEDSGNVFVGWNVG